MSWQTVSKKPKKSKKDIDDEDHEIDDGSHLKLNSQYIFWCHDIHSKDWSINGYKKLCYINNVSEFWRLFNNLDKMDYKHTNYFLMIHNTEPTWEHPNNRDGGVCSLKVPIDESINIFTNLCMHMVINKLSKIKGDINGLSICPKNNWAIIKIWNKDRNNDLTNSLCDPIIEKYKVHSIKYKANEPEYEY